MIHAIYRRYRPQTFDEVIGQQQVTEPLKNSLKSGRINHAYLFSGPRGCGKTTSARIMARCLNCKEGPTPNPCGKCSSCIDLSINGGGSLDVVEIDAASHNGVDEARALREKAFFAPVRDRYKIFILDEAHMVTTQGFNALLKLVEEPPEHVKFIFATTEPEKVISTIKSRTHHYPFRLVAPKILRDFLIKICEQEKIKCDNSVINMIIRAGAGSVRDTLSILDQCIAGCDNNTLDYESTRQLLGYTDTAMLDSIIDAFATKDGALVYELVEKIVDSGQDPKRFIEDLLQKIRDLILIGISENHAKTVLNTYSDEQFEKMRKQTQMWGLQNLRNAADCCVQALNEIVGATSARIHLELLCARIIVPAIENCASSVTTVDLNNTDTQDREKNKPIQNLSDNTFSDVTKQLVENSVLSTQIYPEDEQFNTLAKTKKPGETLAPANFGKPIVMPDLNKQNNSVADKLMAENARKNIPEQEIKASNKLQSEKIACENVSLNSDLIRLRWDEICEKVKMHKKSTWALISRNAKPGAFENNILHLHFGTSALANMFRSGPHIETLVKAIQEILGINVKISTTDKKIEDNKDNLQKTGENFKNTSQSNIHTVAKVTPINAKIDSEDTNMNEKVGVHSYEEKEFEKINHTSFAPNVQNTSNEQSVLKSSKDSYVSAQQDIDENDYYTDEQLVDSADEFENSQRAILDKKEDVAENNLNKDREDKKENVGIENIVKILNAEIEK